MSTIWNLGNAIKRLRESKGLTQEQVIDRLPDLYSERSLRRVENGERKRPARDRLLRLLAVGLLERDAAKIDSILGLADYEAVSNEEVVRYDLTRSQPSFVVEEPDPAVPLPRVVPLAKGDSRPSWFNYFTCSMYAALYVISILLETAYDFRVSAIPVSAAVFALMLSTSWFAFAMDARYVRRDSPQGLWRALGIFVAAAILQWLIAAALLPAEAIVRARFQVMTAQAAHLKNTGYFLLIVVFFWLPPVHYIQYLRRESSLGHTRHVRQLLKSRTAFFHQGVACPNISWLLSIWVLMIAVSVPMGAHLLDNLEPNRHLNLYLNLFYTRALLYFCLTIVCLGWFAHSLGEIHSQLQPGLDTGEAQPPSPVPGIAPPSIPSVSA